jgi:hypothetical protein
LCVLFEFVKHDSCQGNTAQALAQWQHPEASSESLNVLHGAMHPASYRRIAMAIEIVVNLPAFFFSSILLLATTIS